MSTVHRLLSAVPAIVLFVSVGQTIAQNSSSAPEGRVAQVSEGATSREVIRPIVLEDDLFTLSFRPSIVFSLRCHYVIHDPCPELEKLLFDEEIPSTLASEGRTAMQEQLRTAEIVESLKELIEQRIREAVQVPGQGGSEPVQESRVDSSRLLLGSLMFAAGGFLSASKNEWPVDEGYVGVGIATVGLGLILKSVWPQLTASGGNMSVEW